MKKMMSLFVAAALALSLTACGKHEVAAPPTVEQQRAANLAKAEENRKLQDMLETQRSTALENATKNASSYFAANPRFDNTWSKIPHTDDQITAACPQGSGWAWVNIMRVQGKEVEKKTIWCSTSSRSLGCYIEADFKKGVHASEAEGCNANLNYPLAAFK